MIRVRKTSLAKILLLIVLLIMFVNKVVVGIDIDESDKNITFVNTAIIKKCSNYLTKLKSALDTFKMMVKRNMIDMN